MAWRHESGRRVAVAFAAHAVLVGTWAGRIPAVKHAAHVSDAELGAALFGMFVGTLAGSWLGGRLGRRLGSAAIVRAGVPGMAAALVAAALARNLAELAAVLVCFGALAGLVDVGMNAQAVTVERDGARPVMSGLHGVWSVGLLVGAVLASGAAAIDLRPSLQFAIVGVAVAAASTRALRGLPRGVDPGTDRSAPRPPWSAALVGLGAIAFCSYFAEGAAVDWAAVFMQERAGTSSAVAAAALAGFSLAMAGSRLAGDRVMAAFGRATVVRASTLAAAAGLGLALAAPVAAAGLAGFALMGAGLAPVVPAVLSAVGASTAEIEAAVSRVMMIAYTGSISGPAAIGFAAGLTGLRGALVIPLMLILAVCAAAGRLDGDPGRLTRT